MLAIVSLTGICLDLLVLQEILSWLIVSYHLKFFITENVLVLINYKSIMELQN